MNEEQTKHDKITPALKEAGWDRAPFKLALEQQVARMHNQVQAAGREVRRC